MRGQNGGLPWVAVRRGGKMRVMGVLDSRHFWGQQNCAQPRAPMTHTMPLSVCLSVCMSTELVHIDNLKKMSVYVSVCLSVCPSVCDACLFVYCSVVMRPTTICPQSWFIWATSRRCLCMFMCLSICLSVCLSVMSLCLSLSLSVCL